MTFNLDRVYMILYDQDLARTQRENPSNPTYKMEQFLRSQSVYYPNS